MTTCGAGASASASAGVANAKRIWFLSAIPRIVLVTLVPALLSYWHLHNWLATQQCALVVRVRDVRARPQGNTLAAAAAPAENYNYNYNYDRSVAAVQVQVHCMPPDGQSMMMPLYRDYESSSSSSSATTRTSSWTPLFSELSPPTITQLTNTLLNFRTSSPSSSSSSSNTASLLQWDGTSWHAREDETAGSSSSQSSIIVYREMIVNFVPLRLTATATATAASAISEITTTTSAGKGKDSSSSSSSLNAYGFRRNDKKQRNHKPERPVPVTTVFWTMLNVGLYFYYWNYHVDPSQVALNGQIFQDYGRAMSGNLAHFEIWHLGLNMMSLSSLGLQLEALYGSIPLLLYTIAFLPLTTLCVVGLHHLRNRYLLTFTNNNSPSHAFPNMVGFSGILFAWMVVATLQSSSTCPIFFLPDVCFETYQLFGGAVSVSLGPLVQLIVLQVILPRASFLGHLAGICVGFLWHWKMLPPLEWLQPSISFLVLWMIGKQIHRLPSPVVVSSSSSFLSATISSRRLESIRNGLLVHCILAAHHFGYRNSLVVSEVLLILILYFLMRLGPKHKEYLGVVGRGYVALVLVVVVTDSLTVGGWLVMGFVSVWPRLQVSLALVLLKCFLLWLSLGMTCHALQLANQVPSNGTWRVVWKIVEPCRFLGQGLADWRWSKTKLHVHLEDDVHGDGDGDDDGDDDYESVHKNNNATTDLFKAETSAVV